jgi:hypothetical protein
MRVLRWTANDQTARHLLLRRKLGETISNAMSTCPGMLQNMWRTQMNNLSRCDRNNQRAGKKRDFLDESLKPSVICLKFPEKSKFQVSSRKGGPRAVHNHSWFGSGTSADEHFRARLDSLGGST